MLGTNGTCTRKPTYSNSCNHIQDDDVVMQSEPAIANTYHYYRIEFHCVQTAHYYNVVSPDGRTPHQYWSEIWINDLKE